MAVTASTMKSRISADRVVSSSGVRARRSAGLSMCSRIMGARGMPLGSGYQRVNRGPAPGVPGAAVSRSPAGRSVAGHGDRGPDPAGTGASMGRPSELGPQARS